MTNLISPLAWATIPFKDQDAFTEFLLPHQSWHQELAKATNTPWWPVDDLRTSLEQNGRMHDSVADALGLAHIGDWLSYDLTDETSFITFMMVHANDHQRLRLAARL
jgi:hypothetical protein